MSRHEIPSEVLHGVVPRGDLLRLEGGAVAIDRGQRLLVEPLPGHGVEDLVLLPDVAAKEVGVAACAGDGGGPFLVGPGGRLSCPLGHDGDEGPAGSGRKRRYCRGGGDEGRAGQAGPRVPPVGKGAARPACRLPPKCQPGCAAQRKSLRKHYKYA